MEDDKISAKDQSTLPTLDNYFVLDKDGNRVSRVSVPPSCIPKDLIATEYGLYDLNQFMEAQKSLSQHECKQEIAKDGNSVSFYPSPMPKDLITTKYDLTRLDETMKSLSQYECKYEIAKDGNSVSFYPSPHLCNEKLSLLNSSSMDELMTNVCGRLDCDNIEGAFTDHLKESNVNNKRVHYLKPQGISNTFIKTYEIAWSKHYPIIINPNHIWLLILQAVALHVDQNSEQLRDKWVSFKGKTQLIVRDDTFIKGCREKNDWSKVVSAFSDQIDKYSIDGTVKLLKANFGNTDYIDNIACKITIMDICKNYFQYIFVTRCGFPKITLDGSKDDWTLLYDKTKKLLLDSGKVKKQFGIEWSHALLPVLSRFIGAFDGNIDCLFWNSMIKRGAHLNSGGYDWYTGWINVFFPIIKGNKNEYCVPYSNSVDYVMIGKFTDINTSWFKPGISGNDVNYYPNGLGSAPVIWDYYGLIFKLKFIAGFFGIEQNKDTYELVPKVGWLIGESKKENEQTMKDLERLIDNNNDNVSSKMKSTE